MGRKHWGLRGDLQGIGRAFATRAGAGLFGGVKGTDWLFHHRDLSVSVGAAVLAVIVLAALGTGSARVRLFTLVAGCYSFVCFVTPVWLRDVAPAVARWPVQVAGRYQAVPLLLLASVVLVVADHYARDGIWSRSAVGVAGRAGPDERTAGGGISWRVLGALGVCLALFVPSWLADFRDPNARQAGPNWPTELAKAAAGCRHRQDKSVTLAIDPARWTASLPCNAFLTGHRNR